MKYTWATIEDIEWSKVEFDSIEECKEDARKNGVEAGYEILIGECVPVKISGIDFDSVLDSVEQNMYDQVGEVSEGWYIGYISGNEERTAVIEKYNKKLLDLVMEYLKEIKEVPNFYKVRNVKEYKV